MRASHVLTAVLSAGLLSCSSGDRVEPPHTYPLGDRVSIGHLIYTVFEKQWHNQLGEGPGARIPQNRFYVLRVSIRNNAGGEVIVPNTQLIDDAGGNYPEANDGEGVKDWIGNIRQIPPGETLQGYLLFDVQPKHYKLLLFSEDEKQSAYVDLPLSFDSDTPDITSDPDALSRALSGKKDQ